MEYIVLAFLIFLFAYWVYAHIAFSQALKSYSLDEYHKNTGLGIGFAEFSKLQEYLYSKKYMQSNAPKLIKAGNRLIALKQKFYVFWVAFLIIGIVGWCVGLTLNITTV